MDNQYEALDELLGATPADTKEAQAKDAAAEDEETEDQSDSDTEETKDEETKEESSDEETDEDEETEDAPSNSTKSLTKALRREREERKVERAELRTALAERDKLFNDPTFLAQQYQKVQTARENAQNNPQAVQIEIPDAPAYPNTPLGIRRMEADQIRATTIMPEVATNDTLRLMVEGLVANRVKPMTFVEAVEEVQRTMGMKADSFRKEGADAKEESVAKKSRMSATERPRAGEVSKNDRLRQDLKSKSESVRMSAGAELLGL